jgi:potassium inwardly-rectifying channel subfamily J
MGRSSGSFNDVALSSDDNRNSISSPLPVGGRRWPRLVDKNGDYNLKIATRNHNRFTAWSRLAIDAFMTLVDARWRYITALFSGAFVVSWLLFALIWWGIVVTHGDVLHANDDSDPVNGSVPWRPCISNVYDFNAALLFSVDLQTTTGYGFGEIETTCPAAMLLFMLQCAIGGLIEVVAAGVLFAKLTRPKRRPRTVEFSRKAVIRRLRVAADDLESGDVTGPWVLQFRVADIRQATARLTSASLSAYVFGLERRESSTGDDPLLYALNRRSLMLSNNEKAALYQRNSSSSSCSLLLLLPEMLTHRIDNDSPLSHLLQSVIETETKSGDQLNRGRADGITFEIVVILEGIDSATGRQLQVRASYSPDDLLIGHLFESLTVRATSGGQRIVDFTNFQSTLADCG